MIVLKVGEYIELPNGYTIVRGWSVDASDGVSPTPEECKRIAKENGTYRSVKPKDVFVFLFDEITRLEGRIFRLEQLGHPVYTINSQLSEEDRHTLANLSGAMSRLFEDREQRESTLEGRDAQPDLSDVLRDDPETKKAREERENG